jgi:hypothetical protein
LRGAPEEERRVERLSGEEEEAFRPDITMKEFLKKERAAAARKTAGLAWLLMKRREYFRGMSDEALAKKRRYYKIKKLVEEAVSA